MKKPKAKKPKAPPTAPIKALDLGVPLSKPDEMTEEQAKAALVALQQKYGALIVNFNNQQAELQASQKTCKGLKADLDALRQMQMGGQGMSTDQQVVALQRQLQASEQELRVAERQNMALQKKVNQLQVEHVSEEEVDQLFYALEMKDHQLAQAQREKEGLEQEVSTARQLTARGTNYEPKFIEIHHHTISDEDDDSSSGAEDDKEGRLLE